MGVSFYAAVMEPYEGEMMIASPVIPFSHWDQTVLADDCDARDAAGLDPFIPNPDYTSDAGLSLSGYNADVLMTLIGMPLCEEGMGRFPIDAFHAALMKARNGDAVRYTEPTVESQNTTTCVVYSFPEGVAQTVTQETGPRMVSFGVPEGYMATRLDALLRLVVKGKSLGATHVCVA